MLYYPQWFLKTGVRLASQLINPPLPKLDLLDLPKQSILHYMSTSATETGPASDDFIFRNITRPIMMGHVVENGDMKGNPRHLAISSDVLIRTYHIKHRRFRIMRSLEASGRDINTLIVYNYGIITQLYRYMRSYYSEYYKWWNVQAALWKNIAKVSAESDRNQFIICNLPKILPSVVDLRLGSSAISQKTIKIFSSPESLMLLEIWKWLGEDRKDSVIANLPVEQLDKMNIIFQESGCWFVMNLGRMNRWRVATKEELIENPEANVKGVAAQQLQRYFLRLMMALFQVRTVAAAEVVTPSNKDAIVADQSVVVKQDASIPTIDKDTGVISTKTEISKLPDTVVLNANEDDHDETITHDDNLEKQLDADLAELELISKKHIGELDDAGEVVEDVTPVIKETVTLEDGVMSVCDRLADNGLLSAGEYRRFADLSKTYRSIVSPNGKETLDKFITIPPAILKIEASHEFSDISTVTDKTMLKSSLHDFDQKYIKHVMQKDVASAVMNIQNAGVAVIGYEVEHVDTILGSVDEYTVHVKPVEGTPSTLRFKLPSIDEDGVFTTSNIRYILRKQRGDLPIRKIAPDSVALTSYYGKTFVNRSSKKVNDYGQWLRNSIMVKGLDHHDSVISDFYPTNVFDNLFNAPRLYSILAQGFRGFTVTKDKVSYILSFDHRKREELYGKEAIAAYEKDGAIIIGVNAANPDTQFLVMDKEGSLYIGTGDTLTDLCTIEELIQLESEKAPIDFAELRVMGRSIPIGIVLGYELGLDKLIKLLNVKPRRVNAGTRVNIEAHEYSIVFSDETLVFSKDDKAAALVLAGFNEYHKTLRGYSVYDFNKNAVYLNILESGGASTRYLREVDLMYQMFIDPITRDILLEMKEPITFHGLLVRSCELLLSDQHPDELDPAFMRIKGYERMSGAVYSEIVKVLRTHNGRSGKSTKALELNPYAVWMAIKQDPSVALVSDINPIENIKETEAVTYSGTGGRNGRSMTKGTRIYHRNDMGTISESTVDSTDVAINVFTSADPQFTSLRGMSKPYKIGETGATALLSTSALISPCSDVDD